MLVLVLADIHGNLDALDAVLADPRAITTDAVVVLGDAVPGPDARGVLARLDGLDCPTHWVRGNGERETALEVGAEDEPAADDLVRITSRLSARDLDPERARALGELPLAVELDGVTYVHATPRRDDEMVTRDSSEARWREVLAGTPAGTTIVAGHTHQQLDHVVDGVRYVNAGSVGMPYEGDGRARWALVADGEPTLYATDYDHETTGRRILDAGWPDRQSIEASLVEPVAPEVVTGIFEALAREQSGVVD